MSSPRQQNTHSLNLYIPHRRQRVVWAAVATFIFVAIILAWISVFPLWNIDPADPLYPTLASMLPLVMMFTPLVATLVVMFAMKVPKQERLRFLGVWPLKPAKRVVWFIIAMIFVPMLLVLASLGVSVLLGWAQLDLVDFSNFRAMLDVPLDDSAMLAVVLTQVALMPIAAIFNAIPAFGEEIGWRGWLLPTLRPLGIWPALLLSGAIWGLWHAPVTLLGHNFNQPNVWGMVVMLIGCIFWGIFFGWLRLRSGSLWPAVIGHAALNASGGLVLLLTSADSTMDLVLVNPLGVSGWIVLAIVTLILVISGQLKKEPELSPGKNDGLDTVNI